MITLFSVEGVIEGIKVDTSLRFSSLSKLFAASLLKKPGPTVPDPKSMIIINSNIATQINFVGLIQHLFLSASCNCRIDSLSCFKSDGTEPWMVSWFVP